MATNIENIGTTGADFDDGSAIFGAGAYNVVWFGADPTGVADSTDAIQAAFLTDALNDTDHNSPWSSSSRGGVFFPPGEYMVTEAVTLYNIQAQGRIFAHPDTVVIFAGPTKASGYAGYIFDNPNPTPPSSNSNSHAGLIEGINFINKNTGKESGCIRIHHNFLMHIRNCRFQGHHGILGQGEDDEQCAIGTMIEHCGFIGLGSENSWDADSIGCAIGPNMRCVSCDFTLWEVGLAMSGAQTAATHCRFEVNYIAIRTSRPTFGPPSWSTNGASGCLISNASFESNNYDVTIFGSGGIAIRDSVSQLNFEALPGHRSETSIYVWEASTNITIDNYVVSGTCDGPTFHIAGGGLQSGQLGITFRNVVNSCTSNTAALQDDGGNLSACEQYNCLGLGAFSSTFANRPTYAVAGMKRVFTDAEVKTSGAALAQTDVGVTAIQGTGAKTVEAVYNGTDWILTAILA
jgi:hypothetical protein